jgi:hypothetical protein
MPTILLYSVLSLLLITTLLLVVRTIIFQWSMGSVQKIKGVAVNEKQVARNLPAAIRCQTALLDDQGTPDPEAFQQLHRTL